eukprot:853542-Lingulodinium_polyedra.AAC.1
MECVSERVSEQFPRESCSEMRSETHSIVAAPRVSQFARSMRRPPHGGRRVERARCDVCGAAPVGCDATACDRA